MINSSLIGEETAGLPLRRDALPAPQSCWLIKLYIFHSLQSPWYCLDLSHWRDAWVELLTFWTIELKVFFLTMCLGTSLSVDSGINYIDGWREILFLKRRLVNFRRLSLEAVSRVGGNFYDLHLLHSLRDLCVTNKNVWAPSTYQTWCDAYT